MSEPEEITANSEVTIHFTLATPEGFEAISTFGEEPAQITLGRGELSDGLERALLGLKVGTKQSVLLESAEAFGPRDPGKRQWMPRGQFDKSMALEPGLVIGFEAPSGAEVAGIVVSSNEEQVEIDFNHPLAGKDVLFTVEVLSVTNANSDT